VTEIVILHITGKVPDATDPGHVAERVGQILDDDQLPRLYGWTFRVSRDAEVRARGLTRDGLDMLLKQGCSTPGCRETHGPMFMHCAQHIHAPVSVSYHEGSLQVRCAKCHSVVATVAVA